MLTGCTSGHLLRPGCVLIFGKAKKPTKKQWAKHIMVWIFVLITSLSRLLILHSDYFQWAEREYPSCTQSCHHFIPSPPFSNFLTKKKVLQDCRSSVDEGWETPFLASNWTDKKGLETRGQGTLPPCSFQGQKVVKCFSFARSYCTFSFQTVSHRILFVFSMVYLQRYLMLILDTRGHKSFRRGSSKLDHNYKKWDCILDFR